MGVTNSLSDRRLRYIAVETHVTEIRKHRMTEMGSGGIGAAGTKQDRSMINHHAGEGRERVRGVYS